MTKKFILIVTLFIMTVGTFSYADGPKKPGPTGNDTGKASEITAATPGSPTILEVADQVGHNKVALNIMWTLITGFLVMFMQAGFAMVETGLTRAKNVAHTMAMNLMIYPLGMLGFWLCGFAIMFGGVGAITTMGGFDGLNHELTIKLFGHTFGLLGSKGFFLSGTYDVAVFSLFLFQMVFMDTTATIPTGAMAERWKFSAFVLYGIAVGTIIYPVYGNWVWGGGWLSNLGKEFGLGHGHVDFAGSSVVHLTGGVIAFVGAWILGPRLGKYNKNGSPNAIPAHSIPMAVIGTFILAFGWFGFNPGSTLAGGDLRIAIVAVNTMIASATGALASMLYMWWFKTKKPDVSMICNGLLAGLVAITAPCAFVNVGSAALIGLIAGVLVVEASFFFERKAKIDDPVGAISVHGVNGAWGIIALGLFADGTYGDGWNGVAGTVKGLFYGDSGQLLSECIGLIANVVYVGLISLLVFKLAGVKRDLRLFAIKPGVRIAILNILGDTELVQAVSKALGDKLRAQGNIDVLVTPEAKSIPLAHGLSVETGLPYVVLRKSYKPYMGDALQSETLSITTGSAQTLFLDEKDRDLIKGKRVALIDDVISTGSTLQGMRLIMEKAGAQVVAEAAIFTEGDRAAWSNIIALGHLPVFIDKS